MVWQLLNYYSGEEQTVVGYKKFNEMEDNVYPSIGLCWSLAINEEKLKRYGSNYTSVDYAAFLAGFGLDNSMLSVKYDDVTPQFDDYILRYGYEKSTSNNFDVVLYDKEQGPITKPGFGEYSFIGFRCFSIEIPFQKGLIIKKFYVHFKSSIFGREARLANPFGSPSQENQFRISLHYRKQLINQMNFARRNWPLRDSSSPKGYLMLLTVGHTEILVRRSTNQSPCVNGIPDYDQEVIQNALKIVGCKPPYWSSKSSLPLCSNGKQLYDINFLVANDAAENGEMKVRTPCRSLESIQYDVMDVETPEKWKRKTPWMNESIGVLLDFTELSYKEIKRVRGMDVQALIGNAILFDVCIILSHSKECNHTSCSTHIHS